MRPIKEIAKPDTTGLEYNYTKNKFQNELVELYNSKDFEEKPKIIDISEVDTLALYRKHSIHIKPCCSARQDLIDCGILTEYETNMLLPTMIEARPKTKLIVPPRGARKCFNCNSWIKFSHWYDGTSKPLNLDGTAHYCLWRAKKLG